MDPAVLMQNTSEHIALINENRELNERLESQRANRQQLEAVEQLKDAKDSNARRLDDAKRRARHTQEHLQKVKERYEESLKKQQEMRLAVITRRRWKTIEMHYEFLAHVEESKQLQPAVLKEERKLLELKLELARLRGVLKAKKDQLECFEKLLNHIKNKLTF